MSDELFEVHVGSLPVDHINVGMVIYLPPIYPRAVEADSAPNFPGPQLSDPVLN